ncbi:phage tail tape measure protein [Marispirochaeta aestuarii]|uniref:phage tail tape measure protein n=1 Tax=Marispirochaeta aestuarii TaxID=1963862 RepID=UPI002ABE39B4|nr:phage tail tape measure protein [Marispirochaeta aestuarii]
MDKKTLIIETKTSGVEQSEAKLSRLGATADKTEKATDKLGATSKKTASALVDKLNAGASKVAGFLNGQGNSAVSKFLGSMGNLVSTIGGVKAAMIAMIAVGIVRFLNSAANAAAEFRSQLANVATLIPGNTQRVLELGDGIQAMSVKVGASMSDLTDATYQVISAFPELENNAQVLDVLELSAQAAAAGVSSTSEAINLLSAVSKGYGDTSKETLKTISDLAFTTVQLGQTTFPELASAIGQAVPLANSLGVSLQELFAAEATLTGVTGNAAEVTTQLRSIFTSLVKPTSEMQALMEKFGAKSGKEFIEAAGGMQGVLEAVKQASEESGNELAAYFGRVEAVTAALALSGAQAETYTQRLKDMENASGATARAFQEISNGVNENGFAIERAAQAWSVFMVNVGELVLPLKALLADILAPILVLLGNLSKMLGSVIQVLVRIVKAVLEFTGVTKILQVAFAILNGIFQAITDTFRWIDQYIKILAASIKDVLSPVVQNLKEWFSQLLEPLIDFFNEAKDGIPRITALEAALWTVQVATAGLGSLFDVVKFSVKALIDSFIALWRAASSLGDTLKYIFTGQWDKVGDSARAIGESFATLGKNITDNWDEMMTMMEGRWSGLVTRTKGAAQEIELAMTPLKDLPYPEVGGPDSDLLDIGTLGTPSVGSFSGSGLTSSYNEAIRTMIDGQKAIERNALVMEQLGWEYDAAAEKSELYNSTLQSLFDSTDATADEILLFQEIFSELNQTMDSTPSLIDRMREGFATFFAETKSQAEALRKVFDDMASGLGRIAQQQYVSFFKDIGGAMEDGVISGREWRDVIANIGMAILKQLPMLFMQAGLTLIAQGRWPLGLALMAASAGAGVVSGYVDSQTSKNAKGNVFSDGNVVAFAKGSAFSSSIVTSPTLFPMKNGTGLMGEAGPEAIMPLTRTADGSLGVRAEGGGSPQVNVVIINNSGEEVETSETENADGSREIQVLIGQVVSRQISQGLYDKPMAGRYRVKAQGY